jgi:predicted ATPase
VLKIASVIGPSFAYQPLRYVLDQNMFVSEPLLRWLLQDLVNRDFTQLEVVAPHLSYRFKHIITHEVTYQTLPTLQRRQLHHTAAQWYETALGVSEELQAHIETLAYHYYHSIVVSTSDAAPRSSTFEQPLDPTPGQLRRATIYQATGPGQARPGVDQPVLAEDIHPDQVRKAIDCLTQAGNRALRLSANQEAIGHFDRGLALLEALPESSERIQMELSLQMGLGATLLIVQGYAGPDVEHPYLRARELCRQLGDTPPHLSRAGGNGDVPSGAWGVTDRARAGRTAPAHGADRSRFHPPL